MNKATLTAIGYGVIGGMIALAIVYRVDALRKPLLGGS